MAHKYEDDLFQHTSMTFGEHLEELRASLMKAVFALAIGFCIGLYFAPSIVQLIQSPLEKALTTYYSREAIEYVNARVPEDLQDDPAIADMVYKEGLVPQEMFVAPGEMLGELQRKYPQVFQNIQLPRTEATSPAAKQAANPSDAKTADATKADAKPRLTKSDLIRVFFWRKLSDDERLKLKAFNVQEGFMIWIKAAFLAGAIISSPFVFYFLWSFVAAGLYPHEKKYVHTFLPVSVGLFVCGAALAFTFVFPPVLNFFFGMTKSDGPGPGAADQRVDEFRAAAAVGLRHQLSTTAVDAVPGTNPRVQRGDVRLEMADRGAADGDRLDGALAGRRPLQHADDAGAAGRVVLRRHRAVQMAAQQSRRGGGDGRMKSEG